MPRPRFQFRLSTLLWITLAVVGCIFAIFAPEPMYRAVNGVAAVAMLLLHIASYLKHRRRHTP